MVSKVLLRKKFISPEELNSKRYQTKIPFLGLNFKKINYVAIIGRPTGVRISENFKSDFHLELLNCWMLMIDIFRNNIDIFQERSFET